MAGELLGRKEKRKLTRTDQNPGAQGALQQHSFLTDPVEVTKMEEDLLDLMKDFNEGKLLASGMNKYLFSNWSLSFLWYSIIMRYVRIKYVISSFGWPGKH